MFYWFSSFKFAYFADVITPGVILAQVIGRIGCTINGCCYGTACPLPWGIVYTNPNSYAILQTAVHPTQVYEIIFLLIIFGVLIKLRHRFSPDGSVFLIYLGLYSLWRFGIGFLRDNPLMLLNLEGAQVVALIVLAIVVPMLTYRTRWVKKGEGG